MITFVASPADPPRSYRNLPANSLNSQALRIGMSLQLSASLQQSQCLQVCTTSHPDGQLMAFQYLLQQQHRYRHILRCNLAYSHSLLDSIFDDYGFLRYLHNNQLTSNFNLPFQQRTKLLQTLRGPNLLVLEKLQKPTTIIDFAELIPLLAPSWTILALTPVKSLLPGFDQFPALA
ncbi:MAG: hypothetical protein AAFZ63_20650 [Bacteroidota bacterium]